MTTKLTLTVEQSVIDKAKIYAASNRISLSKIVEFYLTSLSVKSKAVSFKPPPITRSLMGLSGPIPDTVDDKSELKKALVSRHA